MAEPDSLSDKGLPNNWERDLEQERIQKEMDDEIRMQDELRQAEREQAAAEARAAREERHRQKEIEREERQYGKDEAKRLARIEKEQRAKELLADRKAKEREDRHDKIIKQEEKRLKREEFEKTKLGKVVKTVGNVLVSGKKFIETDGHGRSGRRATLAYRRANREYNSEARRMRSQTTSPGNFGSMVLVGERKMPVRSRMKGMNQFAGSGDPLQSWTSGMLGRNVPDTPIVPGHAKRLKKSDPLSDFSNHLLGR